MAYRDDADLHFLSEMSSKDLDSLVQCLVFDKDGKKRHTEELSGSSGYKKSYPNHNEYWQDIAAEIQTFGANSLATLVRGGKGVLYKEVLIDVANKLKANFNSKSDVSIIEQALLMKVLEGALNKMTAEEREALAKEAGLSAVAQLAPDAAIAIFMAAFKTGGFQSYQLTLIIVNSILKATIGRGLTFAGNAVLVRTASILTGPIGWAVMGAWTAIDLAGPAYRVTMPSVIYIALLRQQHELERENLRKEFEDLMTA